ncbi:MAG: type II toxin-antitoxin system VapC family toxin [Candidatus Diapherotrites archaeon]|nr:type II toxin-antitoxin system VapC family toxin [Candidatus Diapherotrites archaeon]
MIVDASGFLWAVRNRKLHKILAPKSITLIYYELGNVLWKENKIFKEASLEEACEIYQNWIQWIKNEFSIFEPKWKEVLQLSLKTGLNYYDAAYLWLVKKFNEPILTLDNDFKGLCETVKIKQL